MWYKYKQRPDIRVASVMIKDSSMTNIGVLCAAFSINQTFDYDGYIFANDVERFTDRFRWVRDKCWRTRDDFEGIRFEGGFIHIFAVHKSPTTSATRGAMIHTFVKSLKFFKDTFPDHPWNFSEVPTDFGCLLIMDPSHCMSSSMYTPMNSIHDDLVDEIEVDPAKVKLEFIYVN
jgi:hypothetical protein